MAFAKAFFGCLLVLLVLPPAVLAQDKTEEGKFEPVRFKTVDGVTIKGRFYAGENTNAPTVVMLHNLHENIKKKNWLKMAAALQGKGYAVLMFDFRGHGDSTTVEPELFWSKQNAFNYLVPRAKDNPTFIDNKFDKKYVPALVNDIAAAKSFLDKKNDAKECNSSRIILIGAETGATLGAVWLKSEWQRYRARVNDFGKPQLVFGRPIADLTKPPEGNAVITCVWLSISPNLGPARPVDLVSLLYKAGKERKVPMTFIHSKEDRSGSTVAKNLESKLVTFVRKGGKLVRDENQFPFTAAWASDSGKLKGQELLQKTNIDGICDYLDKASKDRGDDWTERDFRKTTFVWFNGKMSILAKLPDAANLLFNDYLTFLAR